MIQKIYGSQNATSIKMAIEIEYIYDQVYSNIVDVSHKYKTTLDPKNNSLTKKFLIDGHDQKTAYALSFTTTIMLYSQIYDINII